MLLASFMHPLWHVLVKNSGDKLISLVAINIVSGSVGIVAIFLVTPPNKKLEIRFSYVLLFMLRYF